MSELTLIEASFNRAYGQAEDTPQTRKSRRRVEQIARSFRTARRNQDASTMRQLLHQVTEFATNV